MSLLSIANNREFYCEDPHRKPRLLSRPFVFLQRWWGSWTQSSSSGFRCESPRFADNEWWTENVSVCVLTSWGARFRASFLDASREPDSRFDAAYSQQLCVSTVSALLLPEIRQQGETPRMLLCLAVVDSSFIASPLELQFQYKYVWLNRTLIP